MDTSPFALLSPELRNQIYELALRSPGNSTLELRDIKKLHALTQTCRLIRRETQPMLYGLNNFAFTAEVVQLEKFCAFLEALGAEVVPKMRSLRLLIIERVPCRGAPLQCSQNIEIRGTETAPAAESLGKPYAISPRGVEVAIFQTLDRMGLQVRGRGSTWYYTTATWWVGPGTGEETGKAKSTWLRVA